MSDLAEWIKERRRIHDAATEGPWKQDEEDGVRGVDLYTNAEDEEFEDRWERQDADIRTWDANDATAIVDAHNNLLALLTAVENVLELHQPVTRYSLVEYEDWSFDSFDEVRKFTGEDDLPDLKEFQLCVECRRVEDGAADNTAEIGYETSLWPCPTVRSIEGAIK